MECTSRSTQVTLIPLFLTCSSVDSDTQMFQRGWGRIDLFKYSVINHFKAISAWRIYINSSKFWSHSLLSWAKDVRNKPEKQEIQVRTGILVGLLIAKVSNTFPACLKWSLQSPWLVPWNAAICTWDSPQTQSLSFSSKNLILNSTFQPEPTTAWSTICK